MRHLSSLVAVTLLATLTSLGGARPTLARPAPAPVRVAQSAASTLVATVIRDGSSYTLQVEGYAAARQYLGFSLYTTKARSLIDGKDVTLELTPGAFRRTFPIKRDYVGGTWAAALWQRKVMAEQCPIKNDPWCKKNGFHMDGMVAGSYRGGNIR
jgi:hypothetical protein